MSWQFALLWCSLGSGLTLLVLGTHRKGRRRNRRIGLPAPACQRFPAEFNVAVPQATVRELPGLMKRHAN